MNILPLFMAIPLVTAFVLPIAVKIKREVVDWLAALATAIVLGLSLYSVSLIAQGQTLVYQLGGWAPPFGINLVLDGLSLLMLTIVALVSFLVVIFSFDYMNQYTSKSKYYTLFMLMIAGMNGVILTGDLFNMFVFLEIAAIASYALVAFGCESEELEASFKYMVLSSVASILILFGIIIIYGMTGTLNLAHISKLLIAQGLNAGFLFSLGLFILGFGVKAALVPFHAWLPDAHPSAPAPISAMLSGVLIKALGAYTLIRIIFNVYGANPQFLTILMTLGSLSMIVGVFLAIGQWDFKRLLAYHSISQMGYVILGIGLGTPLGILGGLFHLFNHATFKSLLFLNSGAVEYSAHTRDLKQMGGLAKKMPVTYFTSLIASLSIAGVPPFNGFWSKLLIIMAAIFSAQYIHAGLAILASIITLASFLKVQKYAFQGDLKEEHNNLKEVPVRMLVPMIVLALICLLTGVFSTFFVNSLIKPAVGNVLQGIFYAPIVLGK